MARLVRKQEDFLGGEPTRLPHFSRRPRRHSQVETLTDDIPVLDVFSYTYGGGGGVVMVDETGALHRQVECPPLIEHP